MTCTDFSIAPPTRGDSILHKPIAHRALLVIVFAVALAPTLTWVEFSGGMENFNVATAMESLRDSHWLMPYLGLEPRAAKPPLLHWITALGLMSSPRSPAWGARWPSLVASCAMLIAVYELGRAIDDWPLGLTGAFVCGTTLLFLKFAWQASYDLHLALWVTVANACLAMALFRGRLWSGCLGAGVAIGLALMTKGPVALLQTLFPFAAFVWLYWWRTGGRWGQAIQQPVPFGVVESTPGQLQADVSWAAWRAWILPLIAGLGVMLAIALPWTLYAARFRPHMAGYIYDEVTLATEAGYETRTRWHSYIVFFPMLLPWLIWFFTGFVQVVRTRRVQSVSGLWLAICWVVLPIAVMTFFPERRDRYLLPMIGPTALIAAYGVLCHVPRWRRWNNLQRLLVLLHAAVLGVLTIGLPLWGAVSAHLSIPDNRKLLTVDGAAWYSPRFAALALGAAVVIFAASVVIYRRNRVGFIAGTIALMFLANAVFLYGYKDSLSGRSQGRVLAMRILGPYPDAQVYNAGGLRKFLPLELLIYLNRDVPQVPNPTKLPPSVRPQVLIYPPDEKHPDRLPSPPPGFRQLTATKINNGVYHAYVRNDIPLATAP